MKHVKQTLAIALTLLMLVTAVPFSAFGAALTPEQQKCEHTWSNSIDLAKSEVAEAATCKTKAKYYKTCSKCGASAGDVDGAKNQVVEYAAGSFDPNNHPTDKIVPVKPEAKDNVICQTGGWTPGKKCEACGKVIEEPTYYASAQAHKAAPGKEANCQSLATCEYCGKLFGNKDPYNHPQDQVVTIKNGKEPTCGIPGEKAILYCNGCKKKIQSDDPIPATGKHTGGTATCIAKAKCTVCGQEYGSVNASNHIDNNNDGICDRCAKSIVNPKVQVLKSIYDQIPKKDQWSQFVDTDQLAKFYDDATAMLAAPDSYTQSNIDMTATNLKGAWDAIRYHTTDIVVTPSNLTVGVGETVTLSATLLPDKAGDMVQWITNAPDVVTVTASGENNAIATVEVLKYSEDTVTITAVSNGKNTSCTLSVEKPDDQPEEEPQGFFARIAAFFRNLFARLFGGRNR